VRAIAVARLACRNVPSIRLTGRLRSKLAQVAIVYGADDIDVSRRGHRGAGRRRSASEDIERGSVLPLLCGRFKRRFELRS
jgi:hypothetical protein